MPGISDPGSRVVAAAVEAGVTGHRGPGPVGGPGRTGDQRAPHRPLLLRGLPAPLRDGTGGRDSRHWADEPRTTVLFEAPGRVAGTLRDLAVACGDGTAGGSGPRADQAARGDVAGLTGRSGAVGRAPQPVRGEVVMVLAGAAPVEIPAVSDAVLTSRPGRAVGDTGKRTRGVVDDVAAVFGVPRKRVYDLALAIQKAVPPGPNRRGSRSRSQSDAESRNNSRNEGRQGGISNVRTKQDGHDAGPGDRTRTRSPKDWTGLRSPPAASGVSRSSSGPSPGWSTPSPGTRVATSTTRPTSRCARGAPVTPRRCW